MKKSIILLCIHMFPLVAEFTIRYCRDMRTRTFDVRPEFLTTFLTYLLFGIMMSILRNEVKSIGNKMAICCLGISIVVTIIPWISYYYISPLGVILIGFWLHTICKITRIRLR